MIMKYLDLGSVRELARVNVNGIPAGITWFAPCPGHSFRGYPQ